jgi:hypothetical protein
MFDAAEIFPDFAVVRTRLEVQHNSGGEPEVILSVTEEARLQDITLEPPSNSMEKAIIDATTQGIGKRSIRRGIGTEVSHAKQSMSEGRELSDRNRNSRAKDHVIHAVARTVVTADIGHKADPREEFALQRSLPTVQIGMTSRIEVCPVVGITEKNVALCWNLG